MLLLCGVCVCVAAVDVVVDDNVVVLLLCVGGGLFRS